MEYLLFKRNSYFLKGLLSFGLVIVLMDDLGAFFAFSDLLLVGATVATMSFYLLFMAWKCERLLALKEARILFRQKLTPAQEEAQRERVRKLLEDEDNEWDR